MNFYTAIAAHYDDIFPFDDAMATFLREEFAGREKLLDIACGSGSYALWLGENGHGVLGVDSDDAMVEAAQAKLAGKPGADVLDIAPASNASFLVMDMLELDDLPDSSFDGIYCIGNSLAHLGSMAEAGRAVAGMRRILRSGGRIVLQGINTAGVLARGGELPPLENARVRFIRRYTVRDDETVWFDTELTVKASPHGTAGPDTVHRQRIALLRLDGPDLGRVLAGAGFGNIRLWGSCGRAPYDPSSSFVAIVTADPFRKLG